MDTTMNNDTPLKLEEGAQQGVKVALGVAAAAAVVTVGAMAGADTTFDTALTTVSGYVSGSAGKLAAMVSLGYGVVKMSTAGWSLGHVGVPLTVGIAAGIGGPIVQSSVTATI